MTHKAHCAEIKARLNDFKIAEQRKEREAEEERLQWRKESDRKTNHSNSKMKLKLKGSQHYKVLLYAWIETGNEPTHLYDYPSSQTEFYFSNHDLVVYPLYGANSKEIIVKKGCSVTVKDLGHNSVFFWDEDGDPQALGYFIPVYSDF